MDFQIRETDDFHALSQLFHDSGMGVPVSERTPPQVMKMWRMEDANGNLMAAVTLEMRDGVCALGDIAVRADLQKQGYGRQMLFTAYEAAREMGVHELWACARVPAFYQHHGWEIVPWADAPSVAVYCDACGKRGVRCHPQIVRYRL